MLIKCAFYVSGVQPPNSSTIRVPVSSARVFQFVVNGGRAYVNVVQLDDDPAIGSPASFGIVPPADSSGTSPGWAASPTGIWFTAVWWENVCDALGEAG